MGANDFQTEGRGANAALAFRNAVDAAQYENGNGGYTGTIAEKSSYTLVNPAEGETWQQCLERHEQQETFGDKWGPAGCVMAEVGVYVFFGWASS